MAETETSTPDVQITTQVYTIIRSLLQISGTFGITWGQTVSGQCGNKSPARLQS
jgi:hypothetical protein